MSKLKIKNQFAVVTGGSKGIGLAITKYLLENNYYVAFCYRNENDASKALDELSHFRKKLLPFRADMSNIEEIKYFIEQVVQQFGRIDVLVNNAGITRDGLLVSMNDKDIQQLLNVNLISYIYCCREVLKVMLSQRSGNIINLSSISASYPNRGQVIYAATKGAIESITRALAVEMASKNIRVNAIAPGLIQTSMTSALIDQYTSIIENRILCRRVGHVEDIVHGVDYILKNSYVTGEIININGGLSLS
jgi:3-oxoacyl-[acyl-carrier protein] reductase